MKKFFFLPLLLCLVGAAYGQNLKSAKADTYYAAYQFAAAAQAYEKVLQLEPGNTEVMVKLVQCYTRLENPDKANYWLGKALKASSATDGKYAKQLAALLARSARYPEAAQLYGKAAANNDAESRKWQLAYQNLPAFYEDSLLYTIRKATFNSTFSDFSPAFYKKGVVFSSSRSHKGKVNLIQKNFASFIDLFYATTDAAAPVPFSAELNSGYHEGPLSFNLTQDTVYFTRTNTQQKTGLKKEQHTLQIYAAVLKDQKWQKIPALPFNQTGYSVGHPALFNYNTMYFISDMPGGLGGTDLYKTSRVGGVWQTPVNLGPEINTSGNEMFPFVAENGTLYFASNGHPGLGGLDIFYAAPTEAGFGAAKSMGYQIKTPALYFGW
jgi:tetratricopeptide (TPR) repeat protein